MKISTFYNWHPVPIKPAKNARSLFQAQIVKFDQTNQWPTKGLLFIGINKKSASFFCVWTLFNRQSGIKCTMVGFVIVGQMGFLILLIRSLFLQSSIPWFKTISQWRRLNLKLHYHIYTKGFIKLFFPWLIYCIHWKI